MPIPEESPVEFVEVAATPLRKSGARLPGRELAMISSSSGGRKQIKDETATTGKNANQHLPSSVRHETTSSPYLHEMNQVVPQLLTLSE